MSTSVKKDGSYTVRAIDPGTIDDIRVMAAKHRVTQAQVIEEAIWHFQWALQHEISAPDGWRVGTHFRGEY